MAWQGASYLSTLYVADGWLPKSAFVPPSISGGYLGADYLSARWVSDGYLPKAPFDSPDGAWLNQKYLARQWVSDTWLHHIVASAGATISVPNVPGLTLTALSGSAKGSLRVNATAITLPVTAYAAVANSASKVTQANVPSLQLATFGTSVNAGIAQVGNITFTVNVASTFGYKKVVVAQNVTSVALSPIAAIVTEGSDLNVAATGTAIVLTALATSVKANSQTRAVSSVPLPIGVFDAEVAVGRAIQVQNTLAVPLTAIDVSVVETPNVRTDVTATLLSVPLGTFGATASGISVGHVATIKFEVSQREMVIEMEDGRVMFVEAA